MTFRTGVIGLGKFGMGLDLNTTGPLSTHCLAAEHHPEFDLVAGTDVDPSRRVLFSEHFTGSTYRSVSEMVGKETLDLVVVATPPSQRSLVVQEIMSGDNPPHILLEKPISFEPVEDRAIKEALGTSDQIVLVNYLRRSDPSFQTILGILKRKELVGPFRAVVCYTGGLYNSASHFVDLLLGWFGSLQLRDVLHAEMRSDKDIQAEFVLNNGYVQAHFLPHGSAAYSHFSVDIMGKNGRLVYDRGGKDIRLSYVIKDWSAPGYHSLGCPEHLPGLQPVESVLRVYDDVARQLSGKPGFLPRLSDALRTNDLLHKVANFSRKVSKL